MEVTRDWLDSISDARGLTRGQQTVLMQHCNGAPFVGKLLDDNIARFLEQCKGYRNKPEKIANFFGHIDS